MRLSCEYIAGKKRCGLKICSGSTMKLSAPASRITDRLVLSKRIKSLDGLLIKT